MYTSKKLFLIHKNNTTNLLKSYKQFQIILAIMTLPITIKYVSQYIKNSQQPHNHGFSHMPGLYISMTRLEFNGAQQSSTSIQLKVFIHLAQVDDSVENFEGYFACFVQKFLACFVQKFLESWKIWLFLVLTFLNSILSSNVHNQKVE